MYLKECRICSSTELELIIDLGEQPWGNHFLLREEIGKEPFYPLQVVYCTNCTAAQLDFTIPKEIMFSDHTYLSGVTNSLSNHFKHVANEVDTIFFNNKKNKSVLDIGSNDGTQLKHYKDIGYEVLGVEPSETIATIANNRGLNTLNNYFNLELVNEIDKKFDVINASGVFFHLEELHSVTEGIRETLNEKGVFVVQFLYMKKIVENLAFDQIYHEHLLYYNLKTIQTLLAIHGLSMFDAYISPIHGGSIVGYVSHLNNYKISNRLLELIAIEEKSKINLIYTYQKFSESIKILKKKNIRYISKAINKHKKIYGMGAPVKGNTLLNYFDFNSNHINKLVEINTLRKGLYSPGSHIPIIMEDELTEEPDIYYVLAWNFKDEILSRHKHLLLKGIEFYFPINPKN